MPKSAPRQRATAVSKNKGFANWAEFFELSKNVPPSALLENAVRLVVERGQALDLGAGSLKDSKFLLSMGFKKVTAIDGDPAMRKYRNGIPVQLLTLKVAPFEGLKLKPDSFDFVSAQYALPFTKPPHLPDLIKQIITSLRPHGIFCAQFFGPRDSWNNPKMQSGQNPLTFTTRPALHRLLKPLDLIYFHEETRAGRTLDGTKKTWHIFQVIALKPTLPKKKRQ